MNPRLLVKEILGLRFCWILIVAVYGIEMLYVLGTEFPDMQRDGGFEVEDVYANAILFGILIGVTLLGQERDHQTLAFLDGLPISRTTVFFHKLLAALMVITIAELCFVSSAMFFELLSRNSLSKPLSVREMAAATVNRLILSTTIVGLAVLFSFARKWFPLLAGLALWGFIWIRVNVETLAPWLDTSALISPSLVGDRLVWPWKAMVGHGAVALFGWIGSAIAFQWRDGVTTRLLDRVAAWRFSGVLTGLSRIVAVIVWIFAISQTIDQDRSQELPPEYFAAGSLVDPHEASGWSKSDLDAFATLQSQHYELIFKESQRESAEALFYRVDEVHEQVREFFQHPPAPPARIVVDMASRVSAHASAQANWTKIRVPLVLSSSLSNFLQTLRHETAHVYIEQLSRGSASDYFDSMRLFHEGVATLVELTGEDEEILVERKRMERWVVGSDSRGRVPLETLCDDITLMETRDSFVVYPLGYVVALSMLDIGGPDLPRRMLKVLHNSRFPPGVKPSELWRIVLQKCDTSLDLLIATYESKLDTLAEREKLFLEGLPAIESTVAFEGDEVVIRAETKTSPSPFATLVCMVDFKRAMISEPETVRASTDSTFRFPRERVSGNRFRYILGWSTPESANIIFGLWQDP